MKSIIYTDKAPEPIGPYSQAVLIGDMLFISGQIPIDPATSQLITGSIGDEARQVMKNLEALLLASGLSFESVVKATIFLSDMNHFTEVNEIYGSYFISNSFSSIKERFLFMCSSDAFGTYHVSASVWTRHRDFRNSHFPTSRLCKSAGCLRTGKPTRCFPGFWNVYRSVFC
jgi:2-iminobutanoate/2-iminopropanoate deaminase